MNATQNPLAQPWGPGPTPEDPDAYELDLSSDGRIARRQRNRDRVVDAYVELLREGVPNPSASVLAERADVTSRTVYRYLRDDLELKREVAERIVAAFHFLVPTTDWRATSLTDRIEAYVTFGLDVYRRTAPIMRTVRANLSAGPVLAEALDAIRSLIREELATLFAPELDRLSPADQQAEIIAIHALILFDSLEYLHEHLDPADVHTTLCRHLQTVLSSIDVPEDPARMPVVDVPRSMESCDGHEFV